MERAPSARRSRRRKIILVGVAAGAVGVLLAIAPTAYDRMRTEVLLRRLESGPDTDAWKALSEPRHAERVLERYIRAHDEDPASDAAARLACPLLEAAIEGFLPASARPMFFKRFYPFGLQCQSIVPRFPRGGYRPPFAIGGLPGAELIVLLVRGDGATPIDLGHAWYSVSPHSCPDPGPGDDLAQYVEYFVAKAPEARLAFERSTWVVFPSAANRAQGPRFLATEDLTDSPDPFHWFPCRPRELGKPGEPTGIELRFASRGSWRQYIPGMDRIPRSAAYSVALDRSGQTPPREPYPLGKIAVVDVEPSGAWHAESTATGPIPNMDRGAHWVHFPVPESEAKLEPFSRIRLIFTPDPDYARAKGFEADGLPPFTRDIFLPPWRAPWPPR